MIKFLWRSDVHVSDHAPASRIDDYNAAIFDKLTQIGEMAKALDVDAVLDGGDFFHIKSPTRNSHHTVQKVTDIHKAYPCPVLANVGNHDVKYGDYSFLDESPLGVLMETGVFQKLFDGYTETFTTNNVSVKVEGIPYHGTTYDLERFKVPKKDNPKQYLIVMAHVLASEQGGSMFEGEDIIRYSDLTKLNPEVDVWCFGHWHKNQGVTEIAPSKFVVNTGSLSRGSLSQDDLERIPVATLIAFSETNISIEQKPLKVAPASEIFDLEGHARKVIREDAMETLVDSFKATLADSTGKPLLDLILDAPDVPQSIKERALLYLENSTK